MAIRGAQNPFPKKTKPKTTVFTSPQKMDPPPAALKAARKVASAAMGNSNAKPGSGNTGASADAIKAAAMASKRKNPNR